jgi:hypothetical protein
MRVKSYLCIAISTRGALKTATILTLLLTVLEGVRYSRLIIALGSSCAKKVLSEYPISLSEGIFLISFNMTQVIYLHNVKK